jgi:protein-S-isoprenylcysteine O-methyltransferase Ste14
VSETVFHAIFVAGFVAVTVVRTFYGLRYRRRKAWKSSLSMPEAVLMGLWGATQFAALLCVFSSRLDFAAYRVPTWASWLGAAAFVGGCLLLWRSHVDLGRNWSPRVEVRADQALITTGAYRHIRHPMYAAHWLWTIGQALLIMNWLGGAAAAVVFLPLYLLRAPREERAMLARFGERYRDYMARTGRLVPRLPK